MKPSYIATAGKTENFFTRNVRLITFLICIGVFLAIFGPLSVFHIYQYVTEQSDTRAEMTVDDLRALAVSPKTVRPEDLDKFLGEVGSNTVGDLRCEVYQIDVGERYFLIASFESANQKPFYMTLTDVETHEELDLLEDHNKLEEFLSASTRKN